MAITNPRTSRQIEKSLIDFLRTQINASWTGVTVVKTFNQVADRKYPADFPVVCVRIGDTTHDSVEIGSNSTRRNPIMFINIFATSDGQRLDLKDFIIEIIRGGCINYNYTYENGVVKTQTANGRITLMTPPSDIEEDIGMDRDTMNPRDRYRHLISMTVTTNKNEI